MTFHVFGHPRSGNHYLYALLDENNFGKMNKQKYGQRGSVHRWPPPFTGEGDKYLSKLLAEGGNHFFYVWRNFNTVLSSLLAKEGISGRILQNIPPNEFSGTPWGELIKKGVIERRFLSRWVMPQQEHMSPYECWKDHVKTWLDFAEHRTDVYAVRYESLMENFHSTMSDMAQWACVDRDSFENILEKVDGAGIREGGFQGPRRRKRRSHDKV